MWKCLGLSVREETCQDNSMLRGTHGEYRNALHIWTKLDVMQHMHRKQQSTEAHISKTAMHSGTYEEISNINRKVCRKQHVMRHIHWEKCCNEADMDRSTMWWGIYGEKCSVIWHIWREVQCDEAHMERTATEWGLFGDKHNGMRHTYWELQSDETYRQQICNKPLMERTVI